MKRKLILCFIIAVGSLLYSQPKLMKENDANVFNITYNLDGGENNPKNVHSIESGKEFVLYDPFKAGYRFAGWYVKSGHINYLDGYDRCEDGYRVKWNKLKIDRDVKLVAKYIKVIDFSNYDKDFMVEMIPDGKKVNLENFAGTNGVQSIGGYYISKYEVTKELYYSIMNPKISLRFDRAEKPVSYVTFYDAVMFCNELTKKTMGEDECCYKIRNIESKGKIVSASVDWDKTKRGYRLPTQAEWEFAARGGTKGGWDKCGYDDFNLDYVAWWSRNSRDEEHPVGQLMPNKAGLYDMSGNVFEWCWDTVPGKNMSSYIRGGCYSSGTGETPLIVYNGDYYMYRGSDSEDIGFRVVRNAGNLPQKSEEEKSQKEHVAIGSHNDYAFEYSVSSYYEEKLKSGYQIYDEKCLAKTGDLPWVPKGKNGIGETAVMVGKNDKQLQLMIKNGFQQADYYNKNSRLKKFRITILENNKSKEFFIEDKLTSIVDIRDLLPDDSDKVTIKLTVLDVYKGNKYTDLCIDAILPYFVTIQHLKSQE